MATSAWEHLFLPASESTDSTPPLPRRLNPDKVAEFCELKKQVLLGLDTVACSTCGKLIGAHNFAEIQGVIGYCRGPDGCGHSTSVLPAPLTTLPAYEKYQGCIFKTDDGLNCVKCGKMGSYHLAVTDPHAWTRTGHFATPYFSWPADYPRWNDSTKTWSPFPEKK